MFFSYKTKKRLDLRSSMFYYMYVSYVCTVCMLVETVCSDLLNDSYDTTHEFVIYVETV